MQWAGSHRVHSHLRSRPQASPTCPPNKRDIHRHAIPECLVNGKPRGPYSRHDYTRCQSRCPFRCYANRHTSRGGGVNRCRECRIGNLSRGCTGSRDAERTPYNARKRSRRQFGRSYLCERACDGWASYAPSKPTAQPAGSTSTITATAITSSTLYSADCPFTCGATITASHHRTSSTLRGGSSYK